MAIVGINAATTEKQAVKAAVAVYHPALDMGDAVKGALETKIRQLRTPPGWTAPIPPPLPFGFEPMNLIMAEYYGAATGTAGFTSAPVTPIGRPRRPKRPNRGPPTAIRRGPTAPAPGNRRPFSYPQNSWQQPPPQPQQNAWQQQPPQYPPQSQPSWQQAPASAPWQSPPPPQPQSRPPQVSQWSRPQPIPPSRWTQPPPRPQPSRTAFPQPPPQQQPLSFSNQQLSDPIGSILSIFSNPPPQRPIQNPKPQSNGQSQFANSWEQNFFGGSPQAPAPPPSAPAPSPSSIPDFTPLASSMPGWINPFYNTNRNPSAWK